MAETMVAWMVDMKVATRVDMTVVKKVWQMAV